MVTKKQQTSPGGQAGDPGPAVPAGLVSGYPIVALGASAGGLEAFEQFLRAMPVDSGLGFVLVQHLDPTHPSILSEILQRSTTMPVVEATDGMEVLPNRVHVIPPNRDMVITRGVLGLSLPSEPRGRHLPIDSFFRALAADRAEAAVGIILSGTGTDGTLGIRAIHGAGGLGLVQEPSTARFDGMPASALKSGFVSQALAVEAMPALLLAHARRLGSRPGGADGGEASRRLAGVLMQLRLGTGHDFSQYKKSTLGRRIERRMTQQGIDDIATYERFLKEHPPEVQTLFREMLINVTSFFRDAAVFDMLKREVLPSLLAHRPDNEINPGRAGENARRFLGRVIDHDKNNERDRAHGDPPDSLGSSPWSGHLMVDDYAGYKALFEGSASLGAIGADTSAAPAPITELACWAHARRKFHGICSPPSNTARWPRPRCG